MNRILLILLLPIISFSLISCNSLNNSDTATVTIETGIGATKAPAPSDVTSISVTVSGSDMSDISASIPTDTGVLTLEVPVGTARLFTVTAVAGNFTYLGSATQDITAGETVVVSISMVKQAATANLDISDFDTNSPASPYIDDYTVTITDTSTSNSFDTTASPASGILTVEVPPGSQEIAVTANIDTETNESAVIAASGSTSATFVADISQNLPIDIMVTETKIVIPDYSSSRIVQIDDISGSNPISKDATGLNLISIPLSTLAPYDIDVDSLGRIYITNNDTTDGTIIRINDISDTNPERLANPGSFSITTLAIDRNNNDLIYFATNDTLYRCTFDWTFNEIITITGITFVNIRGIALDNSDNIYIADAGPAVTPDPYIYKYNIQSQDIVTYNTNLDTPWDVLYKPPYIYAANLNGGNNNLLLRLDTDLSSATGYGTQVTTSDTSEGAFYGPRRFVAILNRKITIIDDRDSGWYDKLISMDDITGTINWETYGNNTLSAYTEFNFFTYC